MLVRQFGNGFQAEFSSVAGRRQNHDHRGPRPDRGRHFLQAPNRDHSRSDHADRVIVHVPGIVRRNHLVGQSIHVRQALDLLRVASRDDASRRMSQRGRTACRHDRGLRSRDLGDPRSHRVHQLVDVHEVLGSLGHRLPDLGQDQGTADDGEGAFAVDDRLDADRLVEPGADLKGGAGLPGPSAGTEQGSQPPALEQSPPGQVSA